jgi:hypothetical protein
VHFIAHPVGVPFTAVAGLQVGPGVAKVEILAK